jgi:hypothetical protein
VQIDGSSERGLMSRFQLRGYHAVYHINGTHTRVYCEGHACEGQRISQKQARMGEERGQLLPHPLQSPHIAALSCRTAIIGGTVGSRALPARQRPAMQLVKFGREGWKAVAPRTGCSSPVSACGRAVGQFTKLPARMKGTYAYLHHERHYSDLTLFAGLLAVPVALGLSFIW